MSDRRGGERATEPVSHSATFSAIHSQGALCGGDHADRVMTNQPVTGTIGV